MDKIAKIEGLKIEGLSKVFCAVLEQLQYTNISAKENIIKASMPSLIGIVNHLFVMFPFKLSGNVEIEKITEVILNAQKNNSTNAITVLSQTHISNGFQNTIQSKIKNISLNFIGRDKLIELIDEHYEDFWRHNDEILIRYEQEYREDISNDNQLRKLQLPSEKYEKLLNIYIAPTLSCLREDPITKTLVRRTADINQLVADNVPTIINGLSGSGKTTLLKKVGLELIDRNTDNHGKKNLPIYILATTLLQENYCVNTVLRVHLDKYMSGKELKDIAKDYSIHLLIDSIDEFDDDKQAQILNDLQELRSQYNINYFIGTRESEIISDWETRKDVRSFEISKFNSDQIRRFVSNFLSDELKTNNLMDALRENKILERLPITPLTISLISILYDETDFEIPATITDIYKSFNTLIVGRGIVSSKIQFIDVTFRERILSVYALHLINDREGRKPLTEAEFMDYFINFFAGKTLPIKANQLSEVLEYLIHNTGILYIKDKQWVSFTHDSYMEFYAAYEIFNYRHELEDKLVENFYDMLWQNVAVFYAGMTKDMPDFAKKMMQKIKDCKKFVEMIACVQGGGYLLQALYLTDNTIRKDIIMAVLDVVLECNEFLKKMATDQSTMFRNYKLPIIQIINFLHFYEMFNSITLAEPLRQSYKELSDTYERILNDASSDKKVLPAIGYKILEVATTLSSNRINDITPLEEAISNKSVLHDPSLSNIAYMALDFLGKNKYKAIRADIKKDIEKSKDNIVKRLVEDPTSRIRFSLIDTIRPQRRVKILVEGKTDAQLLEHAYMALTGASVPYWNIEMATIGGETGGSEIVSKAVEGALNFAKDYDAIIALYDHDAAGLKEYRRHQKDYDEIQVDRLKKHKKSNVYLMVMPVHEEAQKYLKEKQEFNFFELEHYFSEDILRENNMLSKTDIPEIYEINDGGKVNFANKIMQEVNPKIFRHFVDLFELIDSVTHTEIEYEW